jgi:catalase
VADAYAHLKFIGYAATAQPLLEKVGIQAGDGGLIKLTTANTATAFVKTCRDLRFWSRAPAVKRV